MVVWLFPLQASQEMEGPGYERAVTTSSKQVPDVPMYLFPPPSAIACKDQSLP